MVEPCGIGMAGRSAYEWCESCGHGLLAHRRDTTCSVCEMAELVADAVKVLERRMGNQ